ncbi:peptidoglycan DD-metalloendopeptidase family protein [uncultured Nisaea sp.]|jgi:murein DD-endopeptidase MepM/ murein hydrolase activator NlpD|uniref:peptidoglycan DD-metalloendopeptidase family protein n=1 Tax=uncultured Nisaea sp. TaxID=538215 RepID=UPI0030EFA30C|tara:strand:- start:5421 stop:6737 length:1317 start_codon:yes stop_codon:yes gene_type:complete
MKQRARPRSALIAGVLGSVLLAGIGGFAMFGTVGGPDTDPTTADASSETSFTIPSPEDSAPALETRAVKVERGDTLMKLLTKNEVDRREAHAAIEALTEVYDPRRMQIGQLFELSLEDPADTKTSPSLVSLSFKADPVRTIQVRYTDDGAYKADVKEKALQRGDAFGAGVIGSSLYEAAVDAGIPVAVLHDMIRIFSFDVDFQRDIQKGDRFEVLYDEQRTSDGTLVRTGNITYAAMTLSGKELAYYQYTPKSGVTDYFDRKGQSVRKTLMRTPVNGARLSSGFGKRKHPILGFTKMHRGTDFAAPRGTPIMAAGDGVIDYIGRNGSYGNYIRIRHNSTYKTAYAHMSGFKRGLTKGARIKQGETIGYIGTTGRSTGPHLHYEVLENGRQRNPMSVKLPAGEKLKGQELKRFAAALPALDQKIAVARDDNTLVAAQSN